ncbi:SgcJ/EcaC family oxidoreductase [Haloferula sp. BvORR071]|uniref:YybH family protein n=1 Tax=Haloferula sp. BvORR071 TaxID=1396141 RepID=UPI0005516468|nr:SgcJ/EcaC family oxidoreductase [Haloferula sp. BvORR071]
MNPEERKIRELHSSWIDAVNAGDLASLLTWITDDLVLLNPGGPPLDRDGFAAKFSAAYKELRIRCSSELEEVVVVGEVAYTRSRDSVSVTPHSGGEEAQHAGYRITIYRRQADGRWLMARDAHTLSPVEQQ